MVYFFRLKVGGSGLQIEIQIKISYYIKTLCQTKTIIQIKIIIQILNISQKIIQALHDLWFICFRLKLIPSMIVNGNCIYPDTILLNINP